MNKKLMGAVLGAMVFVSAGAVRAEEAAAGGDAAKTEKAPKAKKGKKAEGDKAKGGEKSCKGADGKGCSGAK